ncbi:hypothetical protein DMUE_1093 [Dictyocoela muelleri]|nr:hypothetical protein DMUE_1093 [Dictyocoela muelleri]
MFQADFPIFSIKTINSKIIAAGGGGDIQFGKKNGVILMNKNLKMIDFLQTDDFITQIEIKNHYCRELNELNKKLDDENFENENLKNLKNENLKNFKNEENEENKNFKNEENKNEEIKLKEPYHTLPLTTKINDIKDPLFAMIGTDNLYLVTLKNDKLNLIFRKKIVIENIFLGDYLIFISKNRFYGFTDLNINEQSKNQSDDHSADQYKSKNEFKFSYTLAKSNNKIVLSENKNSSEEGWINFFIRGNRIFKVYKTKDFDQAREEEGPEMFIYKGKKVYGEFGKIVFNKKLIYFDKFNSTLHVDEDVFFVPKISSIAVKDNRAAFNKNSEVKNDEIKKDEVKKNGVNKDSLKNEDFNKKIHDEYLYQKSDEKIEIEIVCGTGDGRILVLEKNFERKVSELPITSVDYDGEYVYFSSFDGTVKRVRVEKGYGMWIYYLLFLIGLFLAVIWRKGVY